MSFVYNDLKIARACSLSTFLASHRSASCPKCRRRVVISTEPWSASGRYSSTLNASSSSSWRRSSRSTLSIIISQFLLSDMLSQLSTSCTTASMSPSCFLEYSLLVSGICPSGMRLANAARFCFSVLSPLPSSHNTDENLFWYLRAKLAAS
jgi:hypothetical protein